MNRFIKFLGTSIFILMAYTSNAQTKLHSLNKLASRADFDVLKGEPLSNNYNGIECIKIVYDIRTHIIYYLESKKYKWHYRFVSEILKDDDELEVFNSYNYGRSANRKYILATFNYNTNSKKYFLQFSASDNISDENIKLLCDEISETTFCKTDFKILLNTTTLLRRKTDIKKQHAVTTSDDVFLSQNYQPIVKGIASGILLFVNADSIKKGKDYSTNILILNGSANDLPICKAIVTNEFQTPLSHICLLTANRNTPCAAHKNIFTNDSIKKYNGKFVELAVSDKALSIKLSKEPDKALPVFAKQVIPQLDTNQTKIISLDKLSYKQKSAYGSKVCNLAEVKKVERQNFERFTPQKSCGIPFYYYWQHIKTNNIKADIDSLVNNNNLDDSIVSKRLQKIRKKIAETPLDTGLLYTITRYCITNFKNKKIRFRSSSNAEDETNFNGAGLYKSTSAIIGDSIKTIEKAIKHVWASLWNERAFFERNYFGIDNHKVAMAILVHEAYDDELVNGVCITKNLYRDYDFGFVINLQKGENEVVSPKNNLVSEQLISFMNSNSSLYNESKAVDWITYSSLNPESSLLSIEEVENLTQILEKIKLHFYNVLNAWPAIEYKDFAMDVEFKIIIEAKKRKIVIKQARPYYASKNN